MSNRWVVERKTLQEQLVAHLRDMIMEGVLKPGEKIQEQDLCDRFNVSRTPIREALRALAAEGFLTLSPNRGARIAKPSVEEIEELYPLIGALEGLAGELACARISDDGVRNIENLHKRMMAYYRKGKLAETKKLNRQIHEAIFEAAGNAPLTTQYRNLMIRTHSIRYVVRESPERLRESQEDHEKMIAALRARDGIRLGQILREHLNRKVGMIKDALEEARNVEPA